MIGALVCALIERRPANNHASSEGHRLRNDRDVNGMPPMAEAEE